MKSLILFLFVFSFDSLAMSGFRSQPQELKEIKIYGSYYPGGLEEIERTERFYYEDGVLEEGETLADKPQLAHKLEYLGKERFRVSKKSIIYCYEKILDEDRESAPVFDPNLRARMYDQEGNLLAEDTLRDRDPTRRDPFLRLTVAYLPYLNNGDVTIRIVRLEGRRKYLYMNEMVFSLTKSLKSTTRVIFMDMSISFMKNLGHLKNILQPTELYRRRDHARAGEEDTGKSSPVRRPQAFVPGLRTHLRLQRPGAEVFHWSRPAHAAWTDHRCCRLC